MVPLTRQPMPETKSRLPKPTTGVKGKGPGLPEAARFCGACICAGSSEARSVAPAAAVAAFLRRFLRVRCMKKLRGGDEEPVHCTESEARLLGGGDGGGWKEVVHRARAVSVRVDRYEPKACGMDGGRDRLDRFDVEGAGKVFNGDLDAGEVVVCANANLVESEFVEGFLALLDLGEGFAGDSLAVLDARGEAGGGGLVPEAKVRGSGETADGGLVELSVSKGSERGVIRCGALAGAEVSAVVEVASVGYGFERRGV